ncbi:MAG: hypothetical protein Kow0090_20640 [Myxococcota bacterium]
MKNTPRFALLPLLASLLFALLAQATEKPSFKLARLKWSEDEAKYNARPSALARLSYELVRRTSIEADVQTADVEPKERNLFDFPLVFMSVSAPLPSFSEQTINNIAQWLLSGGSLVIDASSSEANESIRAFAASLFPKDSLQKISTDNVLFKTFYLLEAPYGRRSSPPYIEGIIRDGRIVLLYSQLDMEGAWARDAFGNWEFTMDSQSGNERELAIRFGVNIVMYALCFDYKNDAVHLPFILKRRR